MGTAESEETNRERIGKKTRGFITIANLGKAFSTPAGEFWALKDINFSIGRGRMVALVGKSGSGKSTLLNMITGIDRPTAGSIAIDGKLIHDLSEGELSVWRGKNVGVVFQFFQLLPTLTIHENVMLPMDFTNSYPARERGERATSILNRIGIAEQANKLPSALSGGQQQRAAIARALANDPPLIVADEPTGNLDSTTTEGIFQLFRHLSLGGTTVFVVTHEREITRFFDDTITIADGSLATVSAGVDEQ